VRPAIRIAPSILASDFTRLGEQIEIVEAAGADVIHIDVMDGSFVPNITMGPHVVAAVRRVTQLPIDVHLMVVEPEKHIATFAEAGANSLTVHVEACLHLHRTVQQIAEAGARPAVALNPATPALLVQEILPFVDMILVMTVNPGFGGQQFIPETLAKIGALSATIEARGLPVAVQVDGGIDPRTAPWVVERGASVLVAGTSIFRAPEGITAAVRALRAAALGAQESKKPAG